MLIILITIGVLIVSLIGFKLLEYSCYFDNFFTILHEEEFKKIRDSQKLYVVPVEFRKG